MYMFDICLVFLGNWAPSRCRFLGENLVHLKLIVKFGSQLLVRFLRVDFLVNSHCEHVSQGGDVGRCGVCRKRGCGFDCAGVRETK